MSTPLPRRPHVACTGYRASFARHLFGAIAALVLSGSALSAQDGWTPRVFFDGFGTLGLVHSSEDQADFSESITRSQGPGHSRKVDAYFDSRLGGQVTLGVGSRFTGVVQVIAERTPDNEYAPALEWANVGFAFTQNFSARAGRIVVPSFLHADSRKVSYSFPWVRPPVDLYGLVPISSLDGVEATYRRRTGIWSSRLNGSFGGRRIETRDGWTEAENAGNVNATVSSGQFTGRIAVAGGTLRTDALDSFFDAFRSFGAEGEAIADRFEIDDRPFRAVAVGVDYNPGVWFTIAEFSWMDMHSAIGEKWAGHVTGGYRWGTITPFAMLSQAKMLSETSEMGLSLESLPPEYVEMAAGLNAGLNAILRSTPAQRTLALGGRWDVRPGVALKAQVDFIDVLGDSYGPFINRQPGFVPGRGTRLLSVSTDFVF